MEKIIKSLEKFYKKLSTDDKNGKKILSIQKFNEVLLQLEMRKNELSDAEKEICIDEFKKPLKQLQANLMNKTESFHQQVYSTISTFSMLLNSIAPKDFKTKMPIRSNEKFLQFLKDKYRHLEKDIEKIELSRSFRTKFDHIQQNPLFDWMTDSVCGKCVVVFFLRTDPDKISFPGTPLDSYSLEYFTLGKPKRIFEIPCQSYYVSPYYKDVYDSLINVFVSIIKDVSK
jgi:hypothetical protein